MMSLDELLRRARAEGANDLHLIAGAPPRIRLRGELDPLPGVPALTAGELDEAIDEILSPAERAELEVRKDVELTYGLPGVARFRVSCFRSTNGPGAVFRVVAEPPLAFEKQALPPAFESLLARPAGFLLLAVPSGSGRSSLFASVVDRIAAAGGRFIATLEDAVEVVVARGPGSPVLQRQIGRDAAGFPEGLAAAARLDVEVVALTDLPDSETLLAALALAEAGRLVVAVTPVPGSARALERLLESVPAAQHAEARRLLAANLLGVLSQVLLRRAPGAPLGDTARVAAHELLLATPEVASAIAEGELAVLTEQLASGGAAGMRSLDDSISALLSRGLVSPEEAHRRGSDKERFVIPR